MIRKEVKLQGQERLQSRQAALLVKEACKYTARILLEQGTQTINVKSMMGILSLGVPTSEPLMLIIDGEDEHQVMDALWPMIRNLFTPLR